MKEILSTLSKQGIVKSNEVEVLLRFPQIRDEIFFPDYEEYGYQNSEHQYIEEPIIHIIHSFDFSLKSVSANRILKICFNFSYDCSNASMVDEIHILNTEVQTQLIEMEILIQKKEGGCVNIEYKLLENYPGTFEEKIRACLKQVKSNYDTYAKDIISGDHWEYRAFDESYY